MARALGDGVNGRVGLRDAHAGAQQPDDLKGMVAAVIPILLVEGERHPDFA